MSRARLGDDAVSTANVIVLVVALAIAGVAVGIRFTVPPKHGHGVLGWTTDETLDRFVVTDPTGHNWGEYAARLTLCPADAGNATIVRLGTRYPYPNQNATTAGAALNEPLPGEPGCGLLPSRSIGPTALLVRRDDFLAFCVEANDPLADVRIALQHPGSATVEFTFVQLAPCPPGAS